jgi:uncharacterized phage protein (TIGR02216 family)
MAFALGVLRWPPHVFWRSTPRELAAAAGAAGRPEPPDGPALADLMATFPDASEPAPPPAISG